MLLKLFVKAIYSEGSSYKLPVLAQPILTRYS